MKDDFSHEPIIVELTIADDRKPELFAICQCKLVQIMFASCRAWFQTLTYQT